MSDWRSLPKDHRKILFKKDSSSTTTHGWTVRYEREGEVLNEIDSHHRWKVVAVKNVTKKGY